MTWLVEVQRPDGTYIRVTAGLPDGELTAEQARAYARTWSWQRNGWYRARFGR